jgi:two-component system, OmpR family, heavy metal sensor histidine kinase CusS
MTVSLRNRFLTGLILSIAFLLAVFSVLIYTVSRHVLIHEFDQSLLSTANLLSAVVEDESFEENDDQEALDNEELSESGIEFEFDVRMTPEFNKLNGGAYYQIENTDHTIIFKSPSLGNNQLNIFTSYNTEPQIRSCILPDGKPGRAIGYIFNLRGDNSQSLCFSLVRNSTNIVEHLRFLKALLAISSISIILLSIGVSLVMTKSVLKPIRILGDQIADIGADKLDEAEITAQVPAELVPITEKLNDLISRLKTAFARQRQYNADVAHELRTPLAGLQTTIEVCLSRGRKQSEYEDAMNECLGITKHMKRMTENLLTLTKLQSNQIKPDYQKVQIDTWFASLFKPFAELAAAKKLTINNEIPDNVFGKTDPSYASIIVSNLIDNAIEYTPVNGTIRIFATRQTDATDLSISNNGCKLTTEDIEHLFDPFWRADNSRHNTGSHCGIGLSIAHRTAVALGAQLTAQIDSTNIFTVTLHLPY